MDELKLEYVPSRSSDKLNMQDAFDALMAEIREVKDMQIVLHNSLPEGVLSLASEMEKNVAIMRRLCSLKEQFAATEDGEDIDEETLNEVHSMIIDSLCDCSMRIGPLDRDFDEGTTDAADENLLCVLQDRIAIYGRALCALEGNSD